MKFSKIIRITSVIILPLLLVSCFSAKTYERPESELLNAQYFRTDSLQKDSVSIATISWKQLFTDPILQGYIEEGLTNNIDIRQAIQQIMIAEAYLKQGKAGYLPTLNASAQYTHNELSANSQFGGQFDRLDQYQLSGGLSWEADIWGKIRSNKRANEATYIQSVAAHKAVKSRLVANIASLYYQLLSLDEQIAITELTIATRESGLETTKALKEAGNVTEVGVKQTEAQLYTAQAILIDLKNNVRLLENSLSILLGSEPKDIARSSLDEQKISTPLKTGVPYELLANRPDVIAAEYALLNSFELSNVARSNFYPSLTLTANGGLQSLDFDKLFDSSSLFTTIVGGLTQPLLNGRKIRTQYEVAKASQEQAKLQFKYTLLNASKEVSDALYSYNAALDKIKVKQKEYEAYTVAREYSQELLDNGLANYLEVLNARQNTLSTNLDLTGTKYARLQSIVDLYEALGGGWQ
ncbi:TolC family protein [Maribacter sp. MAR_2009_72]|uniref:TolC family protein n=1 Tax=Maribacter sp. MAR_2009_72 TaxID=1250050 RepID=UPI00119980D5|nr:TolC family protein [Maribacter sp. MAR_2009_72]TVZ15260.1 NodT family efflux transporter outer membrane factor (OMF) lipoprotein [Maribacter sp. MAR_2009_72]